MVYEVEGTIDGSFYFSLSGETSREYNKVRTRTEMHTGTYEMLHEDLVAGGTYMAGIFVYYGNEYYDVEIGVIDLGNFKLNTRY